MVTPMGELTEEFLDEFMWIEYEGRDHPALGGTREHHSKVFNDLIPRKFVAKRRSDHGIQDSSTIEIGA